MKNLKKILIIFFPLAVLAAVFFFFKDTALAQSIFGGLEGARKTAGFSEDTNIYSRIGMLISVFLGFVGVIFLGLTLYGGFIWMIARGNEQEIEKAKKLIEAAVIGLAIVFAAYAITYFVTSRLLSTSSGSGAATCAEGTTLCTCPGAGSACLDPGESCEELCGSVTP
ncbi:hypothetical protein HZB93_04220 [Candidatus Falkowbacteria bacterium]|nr:hypothetical protein [Candidatus Falkowbacteria bacterium]